jgi:hypothetical protein
MMADGGVTASIVREGVPFPQDAPCQPRAPQRLRGVDDRGHGGGHLLERIHLDPPAQHAAGVKCVQLQAVVPWLRGVCKLLRRCSSGMLWHVTRLCSQEPDRACGGALHEVAIMRSKRNIV